MRKLDESDDSDNDLEFPDGSRDPSFVSQNPIEKATMNSTTNFETNIGRKLSISASNNDLMHRRKNSKEFIDSVYDKKLLKCSSGYKIFSLRDSSIDYMRMLLVEGNEK